jgi:hypothetical protein
MQAGDERGDEMSEISKAMEQNGIVLLRLLRTPYSSIVGGGLSLHDMNGRARFMVMFIGTTEGITKDEDDALCEQFAACFEGRNIYVPERD